MNDADMLTDLNDQFIDAWRKGSWEIIQPILSDAFTYLDGVTGRVTPLERYRESLVSNPAPSISIDQVVVHSVGDTAVVSARSSRQLGSYSRYVDTYERQGDAWKCVHACVWPLPAHSDT